MTSTIASTTIADERFEVRLNELTLLKKGWYDGEQGDVIDIQTLTNARHLLRVLLMNHPSMHGPAVTATCEGGVCLSWPTFSATFCDCDTVIIVSDGKSKELDFSVDFKKILSEIAAKQ